MKSSQMALVVTLGLAGVGEWVGAPIIETATQLSFEQLLQIRFPSRPAWSPAGGQIAFLWQEGGNVDLWLVATDGSPPRALTNVARSEGGATVTGFDWWPDGHGLVYALAGDLYSHELASDTTERLTATAQIEKDPALAPGGGELAFVRGGDIWLMTLSSGRQRRLTRGQASFRSPRWSADGTWLAALAEPRQEGGGEGAVATVRGIGPLQGQVPADDLAVVPIGDGEIVWLQRGDAQASEHTWSGDGRIGWQEVSVDSRRRRISIAAPPIGRPSHWLTRAALAHAAPPVCGLGRAGSLAGGGLPSCRIGMAGPTSMSSRPGRAAVLWGGPCS